MKLCTHHHCQNTRRIYSPSFEHSDGSTAVIDNTDTENMHDFVLPYESTMKTATDNNIPMTASSRFSLNLKTVDTVDFSTRIIPAPYKTMIDENANTFNIDGITLSGIEILGLAPLKRSLFWLSVKPPFCQVTPASVDVSMMI